MAVISIFGSGKSHPDSKEYLFAYSLGKEISKRGFSIATGGYFGLMEAVLKGADNSPEKIGVTTEFYKKRQANSYITKEIRTKTYFQRLEKLIEIADAYIILPGHTGTLLELISVWALKQRDAKNNNLICVVGDKWKEIFLKLKESEFEDEELFNLIQFENDIDDILKLLDNYLIR